MGIRPFFYYLADDLFVFGSEVRQVLAHPLVPRAPDEMMIADLLTFGHRFPERTLYRDIQRLPHAHTLVVDAARSTLKRYWRLDLSRELKLRDDREYAEAFRDQFDIAVTARLRAAGDVGADLSGGLDSSSIVATAYAINAARPESFMTFSMIFPDHPAADERQYRSAVLRHSGVAGVEVLPASFDPVEACAQAQMRCDLPNFPNDAAMAVVRRAMMARGIRVALCGGGAEDGLVGSFFFYADLIRAGRLLKFVRRYRTIASQPDMRWRSAEIIKSGIWPVLPIAMRRALRPVARRVFVGTPPPWLAPAFIRRTALDEPAPLRMVPARQLARYDTTQRYESAWTQWKRELLQQACAELGIEERYPFYDRRLVELMVSLPDEQRWQRGTIKYVLRQSMKGRLPELVRQRSDASKADFTHLFDAALDAIGGERFFLEDLHVAANGWVIPERARVLYRSMRVLRGHDSVAHADAAWRLWTIAAVEMWYRAVFVEGKSRSKPCRTAKAATLSSGTSDVTQRIGSRTDVRP
jgi:asparagine synthase (glutamine-hydrolysing)